MKRMHLFLVAALVISILPAVLANPVQVYTEPDPRQDNWALNGEVEELGVGFPPDENIFAQEIPWDGHIPCPQDYGGNFSANVQIEIINLTEKDWEELYYVADGGEFPGAGTQLSNVDEMVGDVSVPGTKEAFKIDAVGANTPLVYESMNLDGVFEAGETWHFVIQEYANFTWNGLGYTQLPADALGSLGVAYASANDMVSSGSIVAIPEPSAVVLIAMTGGAMVFIRRLMM